MKAINKYYICKVGDTVIFAGKEVVVAEILNSGSMDKGSNGKKLLVPEKSMISVCRIMSNGQVLKRSPMYAGDNWSPL